MQRCAQFSSSAAAHCWADPRPLERDFDRSQQKPDMKEPFTLNAVASDQEIFPESVPAIQDFH